MADITATYTGNMRVVATNPRTGAKMTFDQAAPRGLGESYDPVEALMGALAGCTLTVVAYAGQVNGLDLTGASAEADCQMVENPHRIGRVTLTVTMPAGTYTDKQKKIVERFAASCPVRLALDKGIEKDVRFVWTA